MARKPAARDPKPKAGDPPLLEWIVSGLGLVMVVGFLGVLVLEVASGPDRPPEIEVRVVSVAPSGSGWRVALEAANTGEAAAAQVQIVGEAGGQTAEATLDYLPGEGERPVSLRFDDDPRAANLTVHAVGWIEP